MKKLFILSCLFVGLSIQVYSDPKGLSYMSKENLENVIVFAKRENKPILVYLHSQHCYTSKKFTREVMATDSVRKYAGTRYFCINGDIAREFGTTYCKKNDILVLPVVRLLSPDGTHPYTVDLTFDLDIFLGQLGKYVSTCSILMQADLLRQTSNYTENQALELIGASYAKTDYIKRQDISATENCRRYLVEITKLNHFKDGYLKEWARLVEEEKKKAAAGGK